MTSSLQACDLALLFANGVAEWWRAAVSGVEHGRAQVLGAYLSTSVSGHAQAPAFLHISCNACGYISDTCLR